MSLGLQADFGRFAGVGATDSFPNPFLDIASIAMPQNLRTALYWSEFIYHSMGTLRMAMERIVAYFMTDIEILNTSDDITQKWTTFYEQSDILGTTELLTQNRMCFHGDTRAVTRDGVFRLRDLAGKTVDVLSAGGVYRRASFQSFGRQTLLEVKFSDGRTVLATPEHQWVVRNCSGKLVRVPTTALIADYRIERTVAPRPERNADYHEGVRHGFVFGDGSLYNEGRQAKADFFGAKDSAMLPHYAGHGCEPIENPNKEQRSIHGLAPRYKELPPNEASPSYWYGFVCGFLAVDGSVDTYGCALLTQKAKATLEAIAAQLPRIGMACGPVRGHWRTATFARRDGTVDTYSGFIHYVMLLKRFMLPEDFLIPAHRKNFEDNFTPTKYGQYIGVKSVQATGIADEVFCCVEPETHTFVIDNGILTGNCYGNGFASLIVPFKRFLTCPRCGYSAPLREIYNTPAFAFEWDLPNFTATCQSCNTGSGYRGPWVVRDEADDEEKIKVKIWNPHEIELLHDHFSHDVHYLWRIPEDYKRQIRRGYLFNLERVPKQILEAIHKNQVFRFNPDALFHMKEPTLAGLYNRGWGIPRILSNFRQIWHVQVLRRQNEAIALDYVIPFRVISPAARESGAGGLVTDPLAMYNGSDFRNQALAMVRRRRRDPATMQVFPFPVNYQMFGAEANNLAPRDLLDQANETLLNEIGTPIELYNGSLQIQTAPPALRLFESTFHSLVYGANAFLRWYNRQVGQVRSWEVPVSRLKRVTIADDLEKLMLSAQLMASQQLSGTTVFRDLGYNWRQEQRQIADEAQYQAELQARNQEEMQQAGFAQSVAKGQGDQGGGQGAPQGGGDPSQAAPQGDPSQGGMMGQGQGPVSQYLASMGPNTPVTPQDQVAVASSLATELLGLPEAVKNSELRKLKIANEPLYASVKEKMSQMRRSVRSQAGNQAVGQMQQQLAGAPA